jgi:hypothetical protein
MKMLFVQTTTTEVIPAHVNKATLAMETFAHWTTHAPPIHVILTQPVRSTHKTQHNLYVLAKLDGQAMDEHAWTSTNVFQTHAVSTVTVASIHKDHINASAKQDITLLKRMVNRIAKELTAVASTIHATTRLSVDLSTMCQHVPASRDILVMADSAQT